MKGREQWASGPWTHVPLPSVTPNILGVGDPYEASSAFIRNTAMPQYITMYAVRAKNRLPPLPDTLCTVVTSTICQCPVLSRCPCID